MNEAQTLIDIEKFMSSVCRRDYHWEDFAPDYDQWLDDARAVYDDELKYSPLIQAYFDLMPERIDWEDQDIFEDDQAFRSFQRRLKYQQQDFIEDLANQSDDYHNRLDDYFASLVDRHRKLLLVRVDLSYRFERSPCIQQFGNNIRKLLSRIQNKDTIFKDQVGYAYRLEQGGKSKGYHCHLLVIYNGSERCQDWYLANEVILKWQEIIQDMGFGINSHTPEKKKQYADRGLLGIGMIHRNQPLAVQNALNVARYLTQPEKFMQRILIKPLGKRTFFKGIYHEHGRKYKNNHPKSTEVGIWSEQDVDDLLDEPAVFQL